jgi:hypothetical protein
LIYTLMIPGWSPTPLNQLMGAHWGKAHARKMADRDMLARACLAYGVQAAAGKRRVDMLVVLPKGVRATDPDSLWKATLDGLVGLGALKNDSKDWLELGRVEFARGEGLCTYLTLEDRL